MPPSNGKRKLKRLFWETHIFEGRSFAPPNRGRPVQAGGGVELPQRSSRPEPSSVLRARADCGGRLFAAKLGVVVHYLLHQLLDHLPADDASLLARQLVSPCAAT